MEGKVFVETGKSALETKLQDTMLGCRGEKLVSTKCFEKCTDCVIVTVAMQLNVNNERESCLTGVKRGRVGGRRDG